MLVANRVPSESRVDNSISIVQLNGTFEAFGMLMDFLAHTKPFSQFEAGTLADALLLQLRQGHHLVALQDRKVVGYAGWLLTSRAVGDAWIEGRGKLRPVRQDLADAASLTIVAATEKSAIPRLIRRK